MVEVVVVWVLGGWFWVAGRELRVLRGGVVERECGRARV